MHCNLRRMVEEHEYSSTITGLEVCTEWYSESEFREHLSPVLSSKKQENGFVFWWEKGHDDQQSSSEYDDLYLTDIKERIKLVMEYVASKYVIFPWGYVAQFWAVKENHLTASDQPFAVNDLRKGLCWYVKRCMDHYYVVGANEADLGPVGRVYRSKQPESSPDLRLYSIKEFPLRDDAARCGLRTYGALPVFHSLNKEYCCGVIEIIFLGHPYPQSKFPALGEALKAARLISTHHMDFIEFNQRLPNSEITKMLELAVEVVPELHMAQVWVPCKQCANTSNNLTCMERVTFIINHKDMKVDSYNGVDVSMLEYLVACELPNQQIGKGFGRALMSSNNKSCFCRNICDFSICENPLAHYAQRARLSFWFAICLKMVHNSNELYVVEFFLQPMNRDDACGVSFVHLLLRIMEMELKSFKFAFGGQLGEQLFVAELSHSHADRYHSIESDQQNKHRYCKEIEMLKVMHGCQKTVSPEELIKYLQEAVLTPVLSFEKYKFGWLFRNSNSALVPNVIDKKIKLIMMKKAPQWSFISYSMIQFWAPKMNGDRCYLATLDQPFVVGCLHKGFASFRKQCMEHRYYVDEGVKEEELGPIRRVFISGHPETTPDVRLYSTRDFPLRNHAARCHLRGYISLPVFDKQQHKCVGVLEFLCSSDSGFHLQYIETTLKAADLSSTHINLEPSFKGSLLQANNAEGRKLAVTEIREAFDVITEIPQLYMAEVWVTCSQHAIIRDNVKYIERVFPCSWSSFHRVQNGKGIAGVVLASENNLCFFRNSCHFSIVEQPQIHHAQQARSDVCFAICLKSSHTGDLLYILEFFLYQGPRKPEYLLSFLNFLLPIMKQKLKSFKVASGQQLGEELVVDVIEFSEGNELNFSELHQPNTFPVKFKTVQYGQKDNQHSTHEQVDFVPDSTIDSVRSIEQTKECNNAAVNSKKDVAANKTEGAKRKIGLHLKLEDLKRHFGKRLNDVAEELGVGRSTIKRACRDYGIHRWPSNEKYKKNLSLFETENADEGARNSQQNVCEPSSCNIPLPEIQRAS